VAADIGQWKSAAAVVLESVMLVPFAFEPPAEAAVTTMSSVGT
jgi:hypothetical protein